MGATPESHDLPLTVLPVSGVGFRSPGVYLIQYRDRFYIGATGDVHVRWIAHQSALRSNRHPNPILQSIYNKHGVGAFRLHVAAQALDLDSAREAEQRLLDAHFKNPKCMNIAPCATHPTQGRPLTAEHRAKIAASRRGHKASQETRRKLSSALSGRKQSAAHIANRAAALRGQRLKPVVLEHPNWSSPRRYPSVGAAAKGIGMGRCNLSNRLNGKIQWPTKGKHKGLTGRFG